MAFAAKKARILQQLAAPEAAYSDASPKGSVDAAIRPLIDLINAADGFVTTSSCAGRVAVFLEGRRTDPGDTGSTASHGRQVASVGGKGAGGTWLHVSHEAGAGGWVERLGAVDGPAVPAEPCPRFIHYKFEPMILHVLTASAAHAQMLLRAALAAGFRESGAVSIAGDGATPAVAVRSAGLALESLIGFEEGGSGGARRMLVGREYLRVLEGVADARFGENAARMARLEEAFAAEVRGAGGGGGREERGARRERMRAEGLRRQAELQGQDKLAL